MFVGSWMPFIIFVMRICDVSLGTLRVICIMRGRKLGAALLGFFEILIWILALSSVFAQLHNVVNAVAYAAGFATGNVVGMWIEARLGLGTQAISFVSRGTANAVAECLRFADYCVTTLSGSGRDGPVAICHAVIPRRHANNAISLARRVDPDVVVTVEDVTAHSALAARPSAAGKLPLALRGRLGQRSFRRVRGDHAIAGELTGQYEGVGEGSARAA